MLTRASALGAALAFLCAASAFAQEESVEEPDASDSGLEQPKNAEPAPPILAPVAPAPGTGAAKAVPAKPSEPAGETDYNEVVLKGLNKVTARASTIEAPIGSVVRFGTIEIIAHGCWKAAPEERPENAALLEISEVKRGEPPSRLFLGWMFSSSPALSSLEHPFYDVTVIACEKRKLDELRK